MVKAQERVYNYFGEIPSHIFPEHFLEYIISSEILRDSLPPSEHIDYMSAVIWYLKAIDSIVEEFIAVPYRAYVSHASITEKFYHEHIERSLASCAFHQYSISLGRLSEYISLLHQWETSWELFSLFWEFLQCNPSLKKSLLGDDLLIKLDCLSKLDLQTKRHKWFLNQEEFKVMRNACVGNFTESDSITKILLESQL